ncbi:MAG TPA: F0F1 ATP synthase subunit A [Galbitalea sp.]|jgi:F-type H+-transporting ATPase subunit a|nr:F0F1 ATP synthase subunit A [Galbitalea sp.]
MNRLELIRLLVLVLLVLWLWLGTRRMKLVPGRGQALTELILDFPRKSIVIDTLGEEEGRRFMPILMTVFFVTLGMNLTGIIPGLQLAGTSVIGIPLVETVVIYVVFIYAGIRKLGGKFFKNALFPPGVHPLMYILLTPVEFVSTFIVRPVSLTLRLLMNLVAGHMLLALCWAATEFFLVTLVFTQGNFLGLLGLGTFAFGVLFFGLELFVAVLQAYVIAILGAIYIQLSLADEH